MLSKYDIYKTSSFEDECKEIIAGECTHCKSYLYHGETAYHDDRDDTNYCNSICFKSHLRKNLKDELDYHIELLEKNGDTYEGIIEVELEEEQ